MLCTKCPETRVKKVRDIMGMVEKVERKSPLRRCGNRWDGNIKINLNGIE
jgi:hypothetical protein